LERLAERNRLMLLKCSRASVDQTLVHLREAGQHRQECVVLWLGKRQTTHIDLLSCYRPLQLAKADQFIIPPEGMAALQSKLRAERLMVAAQVHSHPENAFHSKADDRWAIIRHEEALSLVVPRFASDTFIDNFLDQTKVYRFSSGATWDEVPRPQVTQSCLQII
jgi:proteasome lid subunit RPN8/RPN11